MNYKIWPLDQLFFFMDQLQLIPHTSEEIEIEISSFQRYTYYIYTYLGLFCPLAWSPLANIYVAPSQPGWGPVLKIRQDLNSTLLENLPTLWWSFLALHFAPPL